MRSCCSTRPSIPPREERPPSWSSWGTTPPSSALPPAAPRAKPFALDAADDPSTRKVQCYRKAISPGPGYHTSTAGLTHLQSYHAHIIWTLINYCTRRHLFIFPVFVSVVFVFNLCYISGSPSSKHKSAQYACAFGRLRSAVRKSMCGINGLLWGVRHHRVQVCRV